MALTVEVLVEDARWRDAGLEACAKTACRAVIDRLGIKGHVDVSILACADKRIADLNADFRGKPQPTNVLSWPSQEREPARDGDMPDLAIGPDPELGDIAIAYETCAAEAATSGLALKDHTTHLIVHATLHLFGFDHERDGDTTLMEGLETEILSHLGIADPYSVS